MLGSQVPVRFDDVAVYFSEDEWFRLEQWQKELYKDVMKENYQTLVFVGQPEVVARIESGEDPCVRLQAAEEPRGEDGAAAGPTGASQDEELEVELQIHCPEELLEEVELQTEWDMVDILIFLDELFDF